MSGEAAEAEAVSTAAETTAPAAILIVIHYPLSFGFQGEIRGASRSGFGELLGKRAVRRQQPVLDQRRHRLRVSGLAARRDRPQRNCASLSERALEARLSA